MSGKVLVVDDSVTIRQLVTETLAAEGFVTVEASDGHDALSKLTSRSDIALVMCDVNMPGMNGLDLVANARKQGSEVIFVMLTTEGHPELMDRAKRLGVKGWMLKPVKPRLLGAAVKSLLDPPPSAPPPDSTSKRPAPSTHLTSKRPGPRPKPTGPPHLK
jgi:two-component system chemotaxis response regulator CheY